jgi:cell division transport system permease protein
MARAPRLRRSRGRDPLGLRRALSDRLLPALVAAMALLAALALAGAEGAAALTARWEAGAAAAVTVQLPAGAAAGGRLARALAALEALPEVAEAKAMDEAQMQALLRPWLGEAPAVALPLVIELRLASLPASTEALAGRIAAAVPGAAVESHGVWVARLVALARSLQAVALAALALVAGIAAAVVAVAVQAGIAARRAAIALLHDLGATDADIAGRFAGRAGLLVGAGALLGTLLAAPVLAGFADLAGPLLGQASAGLPEGSSLGERLPWGSLPWESLPWGALALLPPLGAALGWLTAQATVRRWLRRLP